MATDIYLFLTETQLFLGHLMMDHLNRSLTLWNWRGKIVLKIFFHFVFNGLRCPGLFNTLNGNINQVF